MKYGEEALLVLQTRQISIKRIRERFMGYTDYEYWPKNTNQNSF